jgi:hypothetical protein
MRGGGALVSKLGSPTFACKARAHASVRSLSGALWFAARQRSMSPLQVSKTLTRRKGVSRVRIPPPLSAKSACKRTLPSSQAAANRRRVASAHAGNGRRIGPCRPTCRLRADLHDLAAAAPRARQESDRSHGGAASGLTGAVMTGSVEEVPVECQGIATSRCERPRPGSVTLSPG